MKNKRFWPKIKWTNKWIKKKQNQKTLMKTAFVIVGMAAATAGLRELGSRPTNPMAQTLETLDNYRHQVQQQLLEEDEEEKEGELHLQALQTPSQQRRCALSFSSDEDYFGSPLDPDEEYSPKPRFIRTSAWQAPSHDNYDYLPSFSPSFT